MQNRPLLKLTDEDMRELPQVLVNAVQAAQIINVTPTSVYRYIQEGKLLGVHVGGTMLLRRSEVEQFQVGKAGRPRKEFGYGWIDE